MNFLELAVRLRERVAERGSGPPAVTGQQGIYLRLVNWINEAYAEIQGKWTDWRFRWQEGTLTTVAAQADIARPAGIAGWYKDAFFTGGAPLPVMEWEQYRLERDSYDTWASGPPQIIVLKKDGGLRLIPVPDDAYTIRYEGWRSIQQMAANDDVPIIPEAHHMAIVYRAMHYYGMFQDAPEVVAEADRAFKDALISLEADELEGQEYRRRAVGNDLRVS